MTVYILRFSGHTYTITAASPEEAKSLAAKKLSKMSGLTIPKSAIDVRKQTLSDLPIKE